MVDLTISQPLLPASRTEVPGAERTFQYATYACISAHQYNL
jgi:hypothetical protein